MSKTYVGVFVALAGPLLLNLGFSEACSGEITGVVLPLLAALPGAVMALVGRFRLGGVTVLGARK